MLFFSLIFLIINSVPLFTQDNIINYSNTPAYYYNNIWGTLQDRPLSLSFSMIGVSNVNKGSTLIIGSAPLTSIYYYYFNEEQKTTLVEALQTYQSWRKEALDRNITNQQEITNFPILAIQEVDLLSDNNTYSKSPLVYAYFVSESAETHFFVLSFQEVLAENGNMKKISSPPIHFDYNAVRALERRLNDEFIARRLSELIIRPNIPIEEDPIVDEALISETKPPLIEKTPKQVKIQPTTPIKLELSPPIQSNDILESANKVKIRKETFQ